jgi:site-specific recombinase XerD
LVSFYSALVEAGQMSENPARGLKAMPSQPGRPRPIPIADQERMLRLPDTKTPGGLRDRAVLECLRHGMRQGEVAGLLVSGVSYDEREQALFLEFRAKGRNRQKRVRDVPLEPSGAMIIADYILQRFAPTDVVPETFEQRMDLVFILLKQLRERANTEHVFVTDTEIPLYQVWINRMFNRYRDEAKVDKRHTVHTFRHRFCTALLDANVDIRDAMRLSGHDDPRSLLRYTHVAKTRAVAGVSAIGTASTKGDG